MAKEFPGVLKALGIPEFSATKAVPAAATRARVVTEDTARGHTVRVVDADGPPLQKGLRSNPQTLGYFGRQAADLRKAAQDAVGTPDADELNARATAAEELRDGVAKVRGAHGRGSGLSEHLAKVEPGSGAPAARPEGQVATADRLFEFMTGQRLAPAADRRARLEVRKAALEVQLAKASGGDRATVESELQNVALSLK